jgi:hypothetical protein
MRVTGRAGWPAFSRGLLPRQPIVSSAKLTNNAVRIIVISRVRQFTTLFKRSRRQPKRLG